MMHNGRNTLCRTARALALLVFFASVPTTATAQDGGAPARLHGRVVSALTGAALAGVTVAINQPLLETVSDSAGHFTFTGIATGRLVMTARRLGFAVFTDTLELAPDDTAERIIRLGPVAQQMNEIVIAGKAVRYPATFEAAYKRAARGRGYFFTRDDIEQYNPKDFRSLLNRLPGVSANDRGVTFHRCQSGETLELGAKVPPAKVQVYIDGSRTTIPANDEAGIMAVIGTLKPHMIQIMEVYTGVATIPAEFLADACAVVVIWTKRD